MRSPFFIVDEDDTSIRSAPAGIDLHPEIHQNEFADYLGSTAIGRHIARQVNFAVNPLLLTTTGMFYVRETTAPVLSEKGSAPTQQSRGTFFIPSAGESSVNPKIVIPSEVEIDKELRAAGRNDSAATLLRDYQFRSCLLNMVVDLDDPAAWRIDVARFRFHFPTPPTSIIAFAPKAELVKIDVQKTGSATISPSLTVNWGAGPSVDLGTPYSRTRGFTTTFSTSIEKIQGYSGVFAPGVESLTWAMYWDKAAAVPGSNKGYAMVAAGLALVQFPKGRSDPEVEVGFEGEARRATLPTIFPRPIEDPVIRKFDLKPNM